MQRINRWKADKKRAWFEIQILYCFLVFIVVISIQCSTHLKRTRTNSLNTVCDTIYPSYVGFASRWMKFFPSDGSILK